MLHKIHVVEAKLQIMCMINRNNGFHIHELKIIINNLK